MSWLNSGDWKPSFDGIAAIVAGVIGFIAIIKQTRSSERSVRNQIEAERENLQKQLEADKNARREEQEKHAKELATALMAEMDDFYQFGVRGLYERMKRWFPEGLVRRVTTFPEFGVLPQASVIYQSITHELGSFDTKCIRSIVGLYNSFTSFLDLYDAYRKAWRASNGGPVDPTLLQDIWDSLPQLILDSYNACELLATERGIAFDGAQFHIAGLDENAKRCLGEDAMRVMTRLKQDLKETVYQLDA